MYATFVIDKKHTRVLYKSRLTILMCHNFPHKRIRIFFKLIVNLKFRQWKLKHVPVYSVQTSYLWKRFFELLSAFLFRCKRQEVSESKQKSKKGIT